jgi:hypothetical protein
MIADVTGEGWNGKKVTISRALCGLGSQGRLDQDGYSFMPANAALRCQSIKADRSSWAHDDGVVGTDL